MQNDRVEYLSPDAWRQWHTELLQSTVNRAWDRIPFYRKAMEAAGVTKDHIGSLDDISLLPFTSRDDLSRNYPYGLFSVPLRDIVRIHTLRSAQANPIALGYTDSDLRHRRALSSRFLAACGVTRDDIVQICLDPGMSNIWQDIREGAEALGALVIPPDSISTGARLRVLVDFKTTCLVTTPSYGLHLLSMLRQDGLPVASLSLKNAVLVGETLTDATRRELEDGFSVDTWSGYGIFEALGAGMAYECEHRCGLHLAMDHFIPEVIDPETGRQLEPGESGELVITTVTARANPLIRFRTGDITSITTEPCKCGRTTWRMMPVSGRCDDLVTLRGIRISPDHIANFISERAGGRRLPCLMVLKRRDHLMTIELKVAIGVENFSGSLPELHRWVREVEQSFEENIGVACRVRPVEAASIIEKVPDDTLIGVVEL